MNSAAARRTLCGVVSRWVDRHAVARSGSGLVVARPNAMLQTFEALVLNKRVTCKAKAVCQLIALLSGSTS